MNQNEELIYGFDPLCGWCFAFRPTLRALREAFPELAVELRYGGLVTGPRVRPIAADRDYLTRGLAHVRELTGVSAGEPFFSRLLAAGTYVSDSEPPCRAIWVAQQLAPQRAYDFADSLPEAYYVRGLPLDDPAVLGELAAAQGIAAEEFVRSWRSTEAQAGTQAAFAAARRAGLTSYPTLLYRIGDRLASVARGYVPPDAAIARVRELRGRR